MIKCIIFDLDGVLVDSKAIHYATLNGALREVGEEYVITREEHIRYYDGLPTYKKLAILTQKKALPTLLYEKIWRRKQELTSQCIKHDIQNDGELCDLFRHLRGLGLKLCIATNSIRATTFGILLQLGILDSVDCVLSNEDVSSPKPHPEIYFQCMIKYGLLPKECLIIEDSPQGLLGASRSGAQVLRVQNRQDLTLEKIMNKLNAAPTHDTKPMWEGEINVVIPMAGLGSRFEQAGYPFPKCMIPLKNMGDKPMIQVVVENLKINGRYTFIVRREHSEKYNFPVFLKMISPECNIIEVEKTTEGAACTVLLAKEIINNNTPLFLANCDQFIEWNSTEFMYAMNVGGVDGGVLTFPNSHPMWSYAKCGDDNVITEIKEKVVCSPHATTGHYYWARGTDFVKYAEQMIRKNLRVNGEFYVAPAFNESIVDHKTIKRFPVDRMWSLGIPSDVEYFVANYKP